MQILNSNTVSPTSTNINNSTPTSQAHAAGTSVALLASNSPHEWIIDTGATNHMVSNLNLLDKTTVTAPPSPRKVLLPNGDVTQVTHVGDSHISHNNTLKEVLYVPKFKVKEIGRERDGLYFLQQHGNKRLTAVSLAAVNTQADSSFLAFVHTQFNKTVKVVRSDNGSEFLNSVCKTVFNKLGILHQTTCAYTPQQNGVAERKHRLPSSVLKGCSPYELLYKRRPQLGHLRTLGCLCFAKQVQETDKLMPRAKPAVLMGFSDTQKGYILLDISTHQFFVNRDVVFQEDVFPFKDSSNVSPPVFSSIPSPPSCEEVSRYASPSTSSPHINPFNSSPHILPSPSDSSKPLSIAPEPCPPLRRSLRPKHPPLWLKDFVTPPSATTTPYSLANYVSYDSLSPSYQSFIAAFSSIVEPSSYAEAIQDSRWVEAMKSEIAALGANHTWDVVSLPPGKVPIGCK
ncbi:PREDICTED: uncharacterized protein LOC109236895 [Nicotiana attenuata]|uniref:uncharacterized protein LOC109236895 n=1 Tax=Nicotiana attenuata TaxID=49451 RepID=UPI0009050A14|nr:PREDICTED: uncharacterized protein LOC109236895 [Nicotiana attenuata]